MPNVEQEDNQLAHLYPDFAAIIGQVLNQANHETTGKFDRFHEWRMYEGYRSPERQLWLYGQGRPRVQPYGRAGDIVTNDRVPRRHGFGLAADIVPYDRHGNPYWNDHGEFKRLGHVVRAHKLEWGGDWKSFRDMPHVQPIRYWLGKWRPGAIAYLHSLGLDTPAV